MCSVRFHHCKYNYFSDVCLRFIYTDIDDVCISKNYILVKNMGKLVSKLEIYIFSVSTILL